MWPSGSEIPVIYLIQFFVINFLGTDLLLYPPVLSPASLKKGYIPFQYSFWNFAQLHLIFDMWSNLKKREIFWECFVLFNDLLTVSFFILF